MQTTITVGTTTFAASDRASAGFVGIDALTLSVDEYSSLDFTIQGCDSIPPFVPNTVVSLAVDLGSGFEVAFKGGIVSGPKVSPSPTGWLFSYHCLDIKQQADYVPVQSSRGSACCQYNLPLDDPEYLSGDAGLSVGQIITRVLTVYKTALNLTSQGIAGLSISGSTATLVAGPTISDLAALTLVPNIGVRVEGPGAIQAIEGFVKSYYSNVSVWVRPDGIIRLADPATFPPQALTVPGGTAAGDPVDWPDFDFDTSKCYTQYQVVGRDIVGTILSLKDGTLTKGLRGAFYPSWTLDNFLQPMGSTDDGTCSVSSTSATVVSNNTPAPSWGANFLPTIGAIIWLYDLGNTGVGIATRRVITANTAYSGGSVISWDSTDPLDTPTYTTYRIVGQDDPTSYVGMLFDACEPSTGASGLDTFVGANMETTDPNGIWWGNMSKEAVSFDPVAKVIWSLNGDYPRAEIPVPCRLLRDTGQVLLCEPDCLSAARQAGSVPGLFLGYPTDALGGLPYDVQVAVPYNRGTLTATAPLGGGFAGTAFTKFGIERPFILMYDAWTYRGDQAAMEAIAAQRLASMCNVVVEGTISYHGIPGGWDVFGLGYSLEIAMGSGDGPLDGYVLPVRSVVVRWPNTGPDLWTVTFRFSDRRQPYASNSNFLHPGFSHDANDHEAFFQQQASWQFFDAPPMGRSGTGGRAMADHDPGANAHPARLPSTPHRDNQHLPMRTGPQHREGPANHPPAAPGAGNPIVIDDAPGGDPAAPRPGGMADRRGIRDDFQSRGG